MIIGVGIDIVQIARIQKSLGNERFLDYCFTALEKREFDGRHMSFAGSFASKEAFVKAVGTGFGKIMPKDIELIKEKSGKPVLRLYNAAEEKTKELGVKNTFVSISHEKEYAVSIVILES